MLGRGSGTSEWTSGEKANSGCRPTALPGTGRGTPAPTISPSSGRRSPRPMGGLRSSSKKNRHQSNLVRRKPVSRSASGSGNAGQSHRNGYRLGLRRHGRSLGRYAPTCLIRPRTVGTRSVAAALTSRVGNDMRKRELASAQIGSSGQALVRLFPGTALRNQGAGEGTRTPTSISSPGPKPDASSISATPAQRLDLRIVGGERRLVGRQGIEP